MKTLLWLTLAFSTWAQSQTCLTDYDPNLLTKFVENGDGTVTDTELGLVWMQCSLGQTWQNDTCEGDASELTWQQALISAHGFTYAGQTGWRVPNVKELASLTDHACVRPAINTVVFPNTSSDDYWTSTPSVIDPNRAWVVAFFNSSNSLKEKRLFVFTRLVRTAD
ncbi:Lcl C-terminal domain-containing protein [Paraglaciecola aestuariivivens]